MSDSGTRGDEEARLQAAYQGRAARQADLLYDPLVPSGRWGLLEADRIMLQALGHVVGNLERLKTLRILEVGCGRGGHLIRLAALGIPPEQLFGVDLIPARVKEARRLHPGIEFVQGNAASTPWADESFDIILQMLCLSSVLDPAARAAIAAEMRRLLRPGGAILSFDFVWNPRNRDTVGIPVRELRRLFPGCVIRYSRVFLAPPIARPVVAFSWTLATILSRVPWLCLHRMAIVRKSA